ncbi:ferredoxin [Bacillus cereus]|nr:ferredoxin [Bacillus cereus]PGU68417.1 ferredoxin [Bacillus cereus]
MLKYAIVDKETCIACGSTAPDIFDYDEEGISFVILDNNGGTSSVLDDFMEDALDASEGCPNESIKITEEAFNGDLYKFD